MKIDITPEAVEHLCAIHEGYEQHGTVATLRALSAALTASQAETAAAYEAAALACKAQHNIFASDMYADDQPFSSVDERFACGECEIAIRALTPADSKAALDRMLADARADGMREAADMVLAIVSHIPMARIYSYRNGWQEGVTDYAKKYRATILAAIPKGKDHE